MTRSPLTESQQAHEKQIHATAESLGKATARGEQRRLQAELYRQISERDPEVTDAMEGERLERAAR